MSDKKGFMGLVALAAAGAGAAMLMKKTKEINEEETLHVKETTENYRNTERGKYDKNSKGIYYSNGNYEAFARPEKPEGIDDKHAYIVGSGLASLAAACFLVRDAQMPGEHIHILVILENYVCIRKLAQRTGDEALYPAFYPSYRRTSGFQCSEIH